jgi:hypothetical protein
LALPAFMSLIRVHKPGLGGRYKCLKCTLIGLKTNKAGNNTKFKGKIKIAVEFRVTLTLRHVRPLK